MTARLTVRAILAGQRLTQQEITAISQLSRRTVSSALHSLQHGPDRCVRVAAYERRRLGGRVYLRPVYELGREPDAPHPGRRTVRRQSWLAHYHRSRRLPHVPASVFQLHHYL